MTVVLENCEKSAVKHIIETPILLNFANLYKILCLRLYSYHYVVFNHVIIMVLINCVPCMLKTSSRANVSCVLTCSRGNVPCVLTGQRALCVYVLTCQRALRSYVLKCQRAVLPYLLTCLRALRALRALVLPCQHVLSAYVPHVST